MVKAIFVLFAFFCIVQLCIIPSLAQQEVDSGVKTKQIEEIGEKINLGRCMKWTCGSERCWCCVKNQNLCASTQQGCEANPQCPN
nr:maternally expressed family protein [Ipomoea batatas]